jgi:hypothetical protein
MENFAGTYIHKEDLEKILAKAGLVLTLGDQPGTRRTVIVNGNPAPGDAPVERNDDDQTLIIG